MDELKRRGHGALGAGPDKPVMLQAVATITRLTAERDEARKRAGRAEAIAIWNSAKARGASDDAAIIDFEMDGLPPVKIDRQVARVVTETAEATRPVRNPYRELGSVEGYISNAERDGFGRGILRFRSRMDGTIVKAVATGQAFQQLEKFRLGEVWNGVRVRVYGVLRYRDLGELEGMDATGIEVIGQMALPTMDDIIDPDFTGGLKTEDYLEELRYWA